MSKKCREVLKEIELNMCIFHYMFARSGKFCGVRQNAPPALVIGDKCSSGHDTHEPHPGQEVNDDSTKRGGNNPGGIARPNV